MWYLSRESPSIKLQQPTSKNPGSSTTRLQSSQNRQQKQKSNNDRIQQRLQCRNTQTPTPTPTPKKQSTLRSSYKKPRPTNSPVERQACQHRRFQQGQTRAHSPPRNSQKKASTKNHEFAWQRSHAMPIPTTTTSQQQFRKLSTIRRAANSGRKPFETKSTLISRITLGISFLDLGIAKLSATNSRSSTKRTKSHGLSG